uniref:Chloride channel protein n=1 Tax=Culicoides sonorensis TaxID=179676 RepID=A0A336KZX9_CULSO
MTVWEQSEIEISGQTENGTMPRNTMKRSIKTKESLTKLITQDEASDDDSLLITQNTEEVESDNEPIDTSAEDIVFSRSNQPRPKSIYESLDYDVCENVLWERERRAKVSKLSVKKDVSRWFIFLLIGVLTALVASTIDIVIEEVSLVKYGFLKKLVDKYKNGNVGIPYLYWVLTNVGFVFIGAVMVTYLEPVAAGSGIPQVKCYLNGIKVPRIVRIKTLAVKAIGVATSVIGGLAGGKEGPMIHSGAVIAAGISQGKSTTFSKDFKVLRGFRDDHEKRDFVVGGAAAGVAAAFGAPIGGILFSLEEAASFWNQHLIWRCFFASVISSFTLNLVLSAYHGLKSFTYPGLFNLGQFEPLPFQYYELPIFIAMGIFGGIIGAFWNCMNTKINIFRNRFIKWKFARVIEAMLIAALSATCGCAMMYALNDCRPLGNDPTTTPVQLNCEDNEYNAAAALWFQTPEQTVKALFHDPPGSHQIITLLVFVLIYFVLSCITFGLNVSLGIFIPTLLVGAAWGRLFAMFLSAAFPTVTFLNPGKYALIGSAAQLGGVLRMTLSLTVILIETTGNIAFALPIIATITAAKYVGDIFNEGIYDTQIQVSKVPMLSWEVSPRYKGLKAEHIMSQPVVCFKMKEKLSYILKILQETTHNGFPIVDAIETDNDRGSGRLRGLILRSQLILIIKRSYYEETKAFWKDNVSIEVFRNEYPRYPELKDINIHEDKALHNYHINMKMFMNPSPYSVHERTSVPRVFQIFRALGLRHLLVVNNDNHVKGIITRKDLIDH